MHIMDMYEPSIGCSSVYVCNKLPLLYVVWELEHPDLLMCRKAIVGVSVHKYFDINLAYNLPYNCANMGLGV